MNGPVVSETIFYNTVIRNYYTDIEYRIVFVKNHQNIFVFYFHLIKLHTNNTIVWIWLGEEKKHKQYL